MTARAEHDKSPATTGEQMQARSASARSGHKSLLTRLQSAEAGSRTMTPEQRERMRKTAEGAGPSEWRRHAHFTLHIVPADHVDRPIGAAVDDEVNRDRYAQVICLPLGDRHGRHDPEAVAAHIAAFDPPTVLALLDRIDALEAARDEARAESHELTKALTGLTCGGSEFFIRNGDRYLADITACVEWVRRRDRVAHERIVKLTGERDDAVARALLQEKPE